MTKKLELVSPRSDYPVVRWVAWASLPLFVAAGVLGHLGLIVSYGFTPLAVLAGVYFFYYSLTDYIQFVVILFAFCPFVRRLADYASSYSPSSPILLAPYLVALLVILKITAGHKIPRIRLVFGLPALALLYGLFVGIISVRETSVIKSLVRWSVPLLFGLFCSRQLDKKALRTTFLKVTLYVSVVAAGYGIAQFIFAPAWDAAWITNVQSSGAGGGGMSFGTPVPFGIRVFSTMNSPGNYASFCCVGLLCSLFFPSSMKYLYAMINGLALLATRVRTSWLIAIILLVLLLTRLPSKERRRILTAVTVIIFGFALCLGPFINTDTGVALIERFTTFGSLDQDASYRARSAGIADAFDHVLHEPFGEGIGYMESKAFTRTTMSTVAGIGAHDIAALELPYELGYLGTLLYMAGVILASGILLRTFITGSSDNVLLALVAMDVWLFLPGTNPFINYDGFIFWMATGLLSLPTG